MVLIILSNGIVWWYMFFKNRTKTRNIICFDPYALNEKKNIGIHLGIYPFRCTYNIIFYVIDEE